MYLDPLPSYGIVGCTLFFIYFWPNIKEIVRLYTRRYDVPLFALIVCFVIAVLVHGVLGSHAQLDPDRHALPHGVLCQRDLCQQRRAERDKRQYRLIMTWRHGLFLEAIEFVRRSTVE